MLETYKNILANKFMRDTNYIIIKDTDDIEELQREWDLFQTQMTKKQQEKSDERSIEIWRMTNQEHYETLRDSLIDEFEQTHSTNDDTLEQQDDYEEEEEESEEDDTPENLVNTSLDDLEIPDDENDITEPMKEAVSNTQKDNIADQFEIDTGISIISTVHGKDTDEMLDNLEKQFAEYNAQSKDHKLRSDDESIAIYNKTNVDRYNDIKGFLLKSRQIENTEKVTSTDGKTLKADTIHYFGEFVSQVYQNMQAVNEAESLKSKQHRRLNDCPYFTPTEMIDMGVYTNGNFYSPFADNDGLVTGVRIPLWFDSYKNMCMDHIFEDYRNDWIDTLDKLYSDFDDIKASGNEEKILARKQSILDLGWNPEIAFNRKNRLKASKRVSDILDKTVPRDIFIDLTDIPESNDEILSESVSKSTHKPVFLIFTQGSTPIVSQGIKLFTGSEYSHASISFDPELNEVYSFNIREKSGFIRENLSSFGENVISVMTFFAPNKIVQQLKDKVKDFEDNKTTFDLRIFLNKILHIDHKVSKNEYHQVCSTFVDTVLKSGSINLTGDINIPDPGQLYDHAKSMPNKIIEVFNDKAPKYDGKKTKRKLSTLLKSSDIEGIEESYKDLESREYNDIYHNIDLWESGKSNLLWITGLSGSGKSTIAKEIANIENAIHVELDNLQRAKMDNWATTKNEVLDSYIESVGGLQGIFSYCNSQSKITWKDIVKEEDKCGKEFNKFFYYTIQYAKIHKNKRIIIEGVQISYYANDDIIEEISEYPVILKMNGPFKTEFRREKRTIKHGIELGDSFIEIFKRVAKRNCSWIKGKFYIDDYKMLKKFKNYIGESNIFIESQLPNGVTLRPATKDDTDNIVQWKIDSIDKKIRNDPKVIKFIKKDVQDSIKDTKMIMYKNETIGMFESCSIDGGERWYIGEIYIISEYRNKGIGTALLKTEIDKHDKIRLQVAQSNSKAKKLYESLGFVVTKINDEGKFYIMDLDKTSLKTIKEQTSILNEVKQFPIEFDKEGNLIIYKARTGTLAFGDEIDDSVQLLESYRSQSNIEGMKYEIAKLWYINDCIEKKLKKRLSNNQYKELIDNRSVCLNSFKYNLEYIMKYEKGFNFSDYYNSTPFSDNSVKITSNTIDYTIKTIKGIL